MTYDAPDVELHQQKSSHAELLFPSFYPPRLESSRAGVARGFAFYFYVAAAARKAVASYGVALHGNKPTRSYQEPWSFGSALL